LLDFVLVLTIMIEVALGVISGLIAWAKHRSFFAWFLVGFFFSLLGVLIVAVIPKNAKKCPKCGELSTYGTTTCEFCGYVFYSPTED